MTFGLTMYPATDGDCLLLTWSRSAALHHILVDLGRGSTYTTVKLVLQALRNIELFVLSHIDADHIAGAIPMVRKAPPPFMPRRVWYNSHPQLVAAKDRHPIGKHHRTGGGRTPVPPRMAWVAASRCSSTTAGSSWTASR